MACAYTLQVSLPFVPDSCFLLLFEHFHRLKGTCTELHIVFLLDDNMPLRSMRQEYYKMARKCSSTVEFAQHTLPFTQSFSFA